MSDPLEPASVLFMRYGAGIHRRCWSILRDEEAAKDAVQEVFLRALTKGHSFRGDCSPMTWLYRVATTYCLQQLRNRRRRELKLRDVGRSDEPVAQGPEDRAALMRLMAEFDDVTQQIVFLRVVDEMTLDEVADVSGYSRKTVAKKLGLFEEVAREKLMPLREIGDRHVAP
jgi:RNA polymerase sigma-70 factor (ECF subfamily)